MGNGKRVSIIMPAYNTEKYIGRTIRSVQEQSIKDWELIIIDDGSVDRTGEIVTCFIKEDERIRLVKQKNQGVCIARNWGISLSKGDYITFLDSDDLWDTHFLEESAAAIKREGVSVVYSGYELFDIKGHPEKLEQSVEYFEGNILYSYLKNFYICSICSIMVERKALLESKILFSPHHIYGEDTEFLIKLFSEMPAGNTKKILFKYCKRPNSATTSKSFLRYISIIYSYLDAFRYLKKKYFQKDRSKVLGYFQKEYINKQIAFSMKLAEKAVTQLI